MEVKFLMGNDDLRHLPPVSGPLPEQLRWFCSVLPPAPPEPDFLPEWARKVLDYVISGGEVWDVPGACGGVTWDAENGLQESVFFEYDGVGLEFVPELGLAKGFVAASEEEVA